MKAGITNETAFEMVIESHLLANTYARIW